MTEEAVATPAGPAYVCGKNGREWDVEGSYTNVDDDEVAFCDGVYEDVTIDDGLLITEFMRHLLYTMCILWNNRMTRKKNQQGT